MPTSEYTFSAELWEHHGSTSWYFISVPEEIADEIEELHGRNAGGFGSVRVDVVIGGSRWATSLFPDKKRGTYLLPVKKAVRTAEGLTAGDTVRLDLAVR
ncbi:DUF1905 domain-containing protein [Nocardia uniformis]|uniref:DUF1905 domain-containing protein n=1 Tax=Nocardia uniformis TaxID=53432 RepID=A0A849CJB0_9NOCA|nr:DUF1905 domain-containing protein [Nocardia uniformis]NNH74381.1 DUF1905 domain-containing protein [Nocardia uniformis]